MSESATTEQDAPAAIAPAAAGGSGVAAVLPLREGLGVRESRDGDGRCGERGHLGVIRCRLAKLGEEAQARHDAPVRLRAQQRRFGFFPGLAGQEPVFQWNGQVGAGAFVFRIHLRDARFGRKKGVRRVWRGTPCIQAG